MRTSFVFLFVILTLFGGPASAQERLTLPDAIAKNAERHPALAAAREGERIAGAGLDQARAAWFPRVDYVESWQRSDQPVFVFGSLLSQSRFGAQNFALDALNDPGAVRNLRGTLLVQQTIFDLSHAARVRGADSGRQSAALAVTSLQRELALATARAYGEVLIAAASRRAAEAAVQAADEDRARAERRRDAGLATDADVLAMQVHASSMRSRVAQAQADETVARATLNDLIAAPLDSMFALEELPAGSAPASARLDDLEREALTNRETAQQAELQVRASRAGRDAARAAFLPTFSLQGGVEFDGKGLTGRQTWWMAGAELRWNLFNGFADRARLAAAQAGVAQAQAEKQRTENTIRLEVRSALAQLTAARSREATGRTAVAQAQEAQRIVRDRYDAGMAGVSDLLRAANALLDAELQQRAAVVDVFVSERTLDRAVGR
jgi:outer membrane protein TolC